MGKPARLFFLAVTATLLWAPLAGAQDDAMEAQRCIWRCLANSKGADDPAYHACIASICDGESAPAGQGSGPAAQSGTWSYGEHPLLGLSAHVQTDDGAVGLSCAYTGNDLSIDAVMSLKIERGLLHGDSAVLMFEDSSTAQTIKQQAEEPYIEIRDNTCGVALADFRKSRTLYLIDGKISEISYEHDKYSIVIERDGNSAAVSTGGEAAAVLGGRAVPLKGSSNAIRRLLAQCPAARLDIENNCGI